MTMPVEKTEQIAGYDFGSPTIAVSPVSLDDLRKLEQTLDWTNGDESLLRKYADLFQAKAEAMVNFWRSVIGTQPHLSQWFVGQDGKPDDEYKARVKRRFVQWVVDATTRPHDQDWLNYQEEIGLRHTPEKKNRADGRHTPPVVPLRYLIAFIPIVADIKRFFEGDIPDLQELRALELAWGKVVHLHVALWARPYTKDGLW